MKTAEDAEDTKEIEFYLFLSEKKCQLKQTLGPQVYPIL
jgi:hypothetical protein